MYLIVYLMASLRFLGVTSRVRIRDNKDEVRTMLSINDLRLLFNSEIKFGRRADLIIRAYAT